MDPAYAAGFSEVSPRYAYLRLIKWGHWKPWKATLSFCFTCGKKIIVFWETWKLRNIIFFSYSCRLLVLDNCGRKGKNRATKFFFFVFSPCLHKWNENNWVVLNSISTVLIKIKYICVYELWNTNYVILAILPMS